MPTSTRTRARNYVAMSPLLRKGGVHERSKSGARADKKHEMQDAITNWREALEEECLSTTDHSWIDSGDDPFCSYHLNHRQVLTHLRSFQLFKLLIYSSHVIFIKNIPLKSMVFF